MVSLIIIILKLVLSFSLLSAITNYTNKYTTINNAPIIGYHGGAAFIVDKQYNMLELKLFTGSFDLPIEMCKLYKNNFANKTNILGILIRPDLIIDAEQNCDYNIGINPNHINAELSDYYYKATNLFSYLRDTIIVEFIISFVVYLMHIVNYFYDYNKNFFVISAIVAVLCHIAAYTLFMCTTIYSYDFINKLADYTGDFPPKELLNDDFLMFIGIYPSLFVLLYANVSNYFDLDNFCLNYLRKKNGLTETSQIVV